MSISKELKVIKAFYEFYSEQNPSSKDFKAAAAKSLVYNGQIKLATLEDFLDEISVDLKIKERESQITKLEKEIKVLKTGRPKPNSKSSKPEAQSGDSCGVSHSTSRSGGC